MSRMHERGPYAKLLATAFGNRQTQRSDLPFPGAANAATVVQRPHLL